jgi:hypothetical protein
MVDWAQKDEERAAALAKFDRWRSYLHLGNWGYGTPAFKRLQQALWDVREYRRISNTMNGGGEEIIVAVRVVADTLANQVQAAAGADQDPATVAWVVAGLRCESSPFCTGCTSCQTVTSPLRPAAAPVRSPL